MTIENETKEPFAFSDLPLYQCHKTVHAALIIGIEQGPENEPCPPDSGGIWRLLIEEFNFIPVTNVWYLKHEPKKGGYFVAYDDGYCSYSPSLSFESGYSKVDK